MGLRSTEETGSGAMETLRHLCHVALGALGLVVLLAIPTLVLYASFILEWAR